MQEPSATCFILLMGKKSSYMNAVHSISNMRATKDEVKLKNERNTFCSTSHKYIFRASEGGKCVRAWKNDQIGEKGKELKKIYSE